MIQKMNEKSLWQRAKDAWTWIKTHPVAYAAVQICGVVLALSVVAHIAMAVGTRHGSSCAVPDFTGLQLDDAEYYAHKQGLKIIINDSLFVPSARGGVVLEQMPKGGVEVKRGRKIYITVNSFHQKQVPLPYVAGRSLRQARNMLEAAGLEIRELVYYDDMATNYVLAQYIGTEQITAQTLRKVEMGSSVTLHVGVQGGHGTTSVPKTVGLTLRAAKNKLWDAGLNVGSVVYDAGIGAQQKHNAHVYMQSEVAGRGVAFGSRIDLHLSADASKVEEHEKLHDEQMKQVAQQPDTVEVQVEEVMPTTAEPEQKTEEFFE